MLSRELSGTSREIQRTPPQAANHRLLRSVAIKDHIILKDFLEMSDQSHEAKKKIVTEKNSHFTELSDKYNELESPFLYKRIIRPLQQSLTLTRAARKVIWRTI